MNILEHTFSYLNKTATDLTKNDIRALENIVAYHSDLYYNQESPEISDTQFDYIFSLLTSAKAMFEDSEILPVWSTARSSFAKVAHSRAMISLDNTYNATDLRDFDARIARILGKNPGEIAYTVECKFDGVGIELIYENGIFTQALTRGDGVHGEDVTQNIRSIANIPGKIDISGTFEIRWEVVMPISSFTEYNQSAQENGEKVFANPRNAASGSVRLLDAEETKKRNLHFYAYDLGNIDSFLEQSDSQKYENMIAQLGKMNFSLSPYFHVCSSIEDVISRIENFWNLRESLDFEIDGLVVKVSDMSLWKAIGFTAHHPRYAIAYKFPAQVAVTKVENIVAQVGRTGTITPVATLTPVALWGVTVSRATLHNYEEIEKLWLTIGDYVYVKRAGEVIPKITGVSHHSGNPPISAPTHCPSCGTPLQKDPKKVRLYCPNTHDCPEQIFGKMVYSVSKTAMNIDWLGPSQLRLFLEKWWIVNVPDIFRLHEKRTELLEEDGYQEKSVNTLLANIETARHQPLFRFLLALNIPGIGPTSAKTLSKLFTKKEDFLSLPFNEEILTEQKDIGQETAKNILAYFSDERNRAFLEKLLPYMKLDFPQIENTKTWKFSGKTFCITGTFEWYSREELKEKIENMWGTFVSSVSKNTDFLFAWEKSGSKLKKAQKLDVQVMGVEEIGF